MPPETRPLTLLLHQLNQTLIEDMEACYQRAGLDYRPRYAPVVQGLRRHGPSSIRTLAKNAGLSHSALSQTVAQMRKAGLIRMSAGGDRREHIIKLTAKAEAMLPAIERQWRATDTAAATITAELGVDLPQIIARVLDALAKHSFANRIEAAKKEI